MKRIIWTGLFAVCMLSACQQDETPATGSLQVELTDGTDTRALPAFSDEMTGQFAVSVYNQADAKTVFQGTCAELNASSLLLKPGDHTVKACFGTNPVLALDEPYYVSNPATVTIVSGKTQTVSLVCRVGNALAAFELTNQDKLEKVIKDYAIVTTVGDASVEWRPGDLANPYFRAGSAVTFYLKGTWLENNQPYSRKLAEIASAEAAHLYKYRFAVDTSNMTGLTLDITVDASVEEVGVSETLPQNWLPAPKISATGFDALGLLYYRETTNAVAPTIAYVASRTLQDVEWTVNCADPNLAPLNGTYTLEQLTPEVRAAFAAVNITLPDFAQPSGVVVINPTDFCTVDSGEDTDNRFALRVKANDRWSDQSNCLICTQRPEFTVSVLPERMWSKEFTVEEIAVSAGDAGRIKSNLVYQYSEDGGTSWTNCNDVRRQKFTTIPANKNYKVRALYRGKLASENTENITLETPAQMPNSDMEDWYYSNVARSINCYFPWTEGGSSFWNTNNTYTTRYKSSVGLFNAGSNPYNCFPAVSYVVGGHGGSRAAEIRSTASGRGNTLPSNVLTLNKVPGELFTAEVSVTQGGTSAKPSGDHYTIDANGRNFNVRPSALRFWYKYAPINADTWRARIVLMDVNHSTIIEQEYQSSVAQDGWTECTVSLDYVDEQLYAKCAYILVVFSSTITSGNSMPYIEYGSYQLWEGTSLVKKDATKCWVGSVLTVDDISLVYDK